MEVYLLYKVSKLGYRVTEVGVTKKYPPKELGSNQDETDHRMVVDSSATGVSRSGYQEMNFKGQSTTKTGVAIIGAGHWGPHLLRNFTDLPLSEVHWVIELDEVRRKAIENRFPSVSVSGDLEDALTDHRVQALAVATPTSTHAAIVAAAIENGKHVLVEKPITNDLKAAVALCRQAETAGLTLMVGHVFLFNPAVTAAKGYIDRGELGPVRYVSMARTNLGPVRSDVNSAWDLASHDISIANHWLDRVPETVSASGGSWLQDGVEDVVFLTVGYPGDVLVHIEASWLNPRKRRLISVVGENRMLTVDDMDLIEPLRIYNKGVGMTAEGITDSFAGFRAQIREGEVLIPHVTAGEPLKAECEAFLSRIRGDDDRFSDGWAGADVVAVLEAADRSIAQGGASVRVEVAR